MQHTRGNVRLPSKDMRHTLCYAYVVHIFERILVTTYTLPSKTWYYCIQKYIGVHLVFLLGMVIFFNRFLYFDTWNQTIRYDSHLIFKSDI